MRHGASRVENGSWSEGRAAVDELVVSERIELCNPTNPSNPKPGKAWPYE